MRTPRRYPSSTKVRRCGDIGFCLGAMRYGIIVKLLLDFRMIRNADGDLVCEGLHFALPLPAVRCFIE